MSFPLHRQLTLAFLVGITGIVLLLSAVLDLSVRHDFHRYLSERQQTAFVQIAAALSAAFIHGESPDAAVLSGVGHQAAMDGFLITVYDNQGRALWDNRAVFEEMQRMMGPMMGAPSTAPMPMGDEDAVRDSPRATLPIQVGNTQVGSVRFTLPETASMSATDAAFLKGLQRALVAVAVIGLLLAWGVGHFLGGRLSRPLEQLTQTAQKLAGGTFGGRLVLPQGAPQEMQALTESFNRLSEALQKQEALRRALFSDVTHELRTPVSTLKSHLEAIQDGVFEPTPERIETLRRQVERLGRLVEDLGRLQQAEASAFTMRHAPVVLGPMIEEVCMQLEPIAEEKDIALSCVVEQPLVQVLGDRDRLVQVLVNLLQNALQFTLVGGSVRVSLTTEKRAETAEHGTGWAVLSVSDTGPGIAAEALPHIFERFYWAPGTRQQGEGHGIGLAVARALVESHGGQMDVESREGKGSRFIVRLPLWQEEPKA